MRRIDALISYSHDHQHALATALRLSKAAASADAASLAEAIQQSLAFASNEFAEHMQREETLLLPRLATMGIVRDGQAARLAKDHLALRTLHLRLSEHPHDRDLANTFAKTLHDHVRWEERELFETWQQELNSTGQGLTAQAIR